MRRDRCELWTLEERRKNWHGVNFGVGVGVKVTSTLFRVRKRRLDLQNTSVCRENIIYPSKVF